MKISVNILLVLQAKLRYNIISTIYFFTKPIQKKIRQQSSERRISKCKILQSSCDFTQLSSVCSLTNIPPLLPLSKNNQLWLSYSTFNVNSLWSIKLKEGKYFCFSTMIMFVLSVLHIKDAADLCSGAQKRKSSALPFFRFPFLKQKPQNLCLIKKGNESCICCNKIANITRI